MVHCFNNFFCQKILNIHDESCISMMDIIEPFTETDIRQLLNRSSYAFGAVQLTLNAHIACERVFGCSDKPNYKDS